MIGQKRNAKGACGEWAGFVEVGLKCEGKRTGESVKGTLGGFTA